jgi:hypothetical protein
MSDEALTSDFVLEDLRRYVASNGFSLSPQLEEVLLHVERLAEELALDPYPSLFMLGLLEKSPRLREAVRMLRGDPDEGARVVREDLDEYPDLEPYTEGVLYSHPEERDFWERTVLIDRTIEKAAVDDRRELLDTDFARALIERQLSLLRKENLDGTWKERALQAPYVMLAHIANIYDESLAVNIRDINRLLRHERSEFSLASVPDELREPVLRFLDDHPDPRRTAFVMMEFGTTPLHKDIFAAIRTALAAFGVEALRADQKMYSDQLGLNVKTYMYACGFGIAVFERLTNEVHNANVTYEVGYMQALGKPVCLLKDSTLRGLSTDLTGNIYLPFDVQNARDTILTQLRGWLEQQKLVMRPVRDSRPASSVSQ